jgi:hypothetical protein
MRRVRLKGRAWWRSREHDFSLDQPWQDLGKRGVLRRDELRNENETHHEDSVFQHSTLLVKEGDVTIRSNGADRPYVTVASLREPQLSLFRDSLSLNSSP